MRRTIPSSALDASSRARCEMIGTKAAVARVAPSIRPSPCRRSGSQQWNLAIRKRKDAGVGLGDQEAPPRLEARPAGRTLLAT